MKINAGRNESASFFKMSTKTPRVYWLIFCNVFIPVLRKLVFITIFPRREFKRTLLRQSQNAYCFKTSNSKQFPGPELSVHGRHFVLLFFTIKKDSGVTKCTHSWGQMGDLNYRWAQRGAERLSTTQPFVVWRRGLLWYLWGYVMLRGRRQNPGQQPLLVTLWKATKRVPGWTAVVAQTGCCKNCTTTGVSSNDGPRGRRFPQINSAMTLWMRDPGLWGLEYNELPRHKKKAPFRHL